MDYTSTFSERLATETETHLFPIAQEALTNVARHANAGKVLMDLRAEAGNLRLLIADDGVGLSSGSAAGLVSA